MDTRELGGASAATTGRGEALLFRVLHGLNLAPIRIEHPSLTFAVVKDLNVMHAIREHLLLKLVRSHEPLLTRDRIKVKVRTGGVPLDRARSVDRECAGACLQHGVEVVDEIGRKSLRPDRFGKLLEGCD